MQKLFTSCHKPKPSSCGRDSSRRAYIHTRKNLKKRPTAALVRNAPSVSQWSGSLLPGGLGTAATASSADSPGSTALSVARLSGLPANAAAVAVALRSRGAAAAGPRPPKTSLQLVIVGSTLATTAASAVSAVSIRKPALTRAWALACRPITCTPDPVHMCGCRLDCGSRLHKIGIL
eukprot:SAG22_NODE_371_length_11566_cov_5.447458_11_plen_177_part_00